MCGNMQTQYWLGVGRFILVYRSGRNVGGLGKGAHREVDEGAMGGMEGWR